MRLRAGCYRGPSTWRSLGPDDRRLARVLVPDGPASPDDPSPVPADAVAILHDPLAVAALFPGSGCACGQLGSPLASRMVPFACASNRTACRVLATEVDGAGFEAFLVARVMRLIARSSVSERGRSYPGTCISRRARAEVDFWGTPRITRELISRRHVTETDLLTPPSPHAVTQSLATRVGMPAATEHLGCCRLTAAQEVAAQEDGMVVQSPPEESPSPPIALDLHGGDAWAWQKTLSGSCPGCPPGATIELLVNGASVPAERKGDTGKFTAVATFDPGDNEVLAVVRMPDGGEVRSVPETYTVRLEPRPTARLTARIDGGARGLRRHGEYTE